ncbi:MAG: hypothetical protein V2A63_01145 [Patescibacteria group bacterium]
MPEKPKNPNRPKLGSRSRDHIKNLLDRPIGKRTAKPDLLASQPDPIGKSASRNKGIDRQARPKKDNYKYLPKDPEKSNQPTLEVAGQKFTVELVEASDLEKLKEIHALLSSQFDADEVDSVEAMQDLLSKKRQALTAIKNKDQEALESLGGSGSPYYAVVLRDNSGKLAAVLLGSLSFPREQSTNKFLPANRSQVDGAVFHGGYLVVRDDIQKIKVGTALSRTIIPDIVEKDAQVKITGRAAEATDDGVENYNNKATGQRRVYTLDKSGNYREITYHQLALTFDQNGNPTSEDVLEHLMLAVLEKKDSKSIHKDQVMDIVFRMWFSFNVKSQDYFIKKQEEAYVEKHGNPEGFKPDKVKATRACQTNLRYVQEKVKAFIAQFDGVDNLHLLTQVEKKRLEQQGKITPNPLYVAKHAAPTKEKDPNYLAT